MNAELPPSTPTLAPVLPPASPEPGVAAAAAVPPAAAARPGWLWWVGALLGALSVASLALVWSTQQRLRSLEQELVRRQQTSQDQSTEARLLARQAHDAAAEVAAKQVLLEARVAESALQRSQIEALIQSLARSRDENVLADVEAALRVAQQQAAITGSVEPLVVVLRQSEERLARFNQPGLERVRRAVARDLDKVRAVGVADLPSLTLRLDELIRQVDELPLLSTPVRGVAAQRAAQGRGVPAPAAAASPAGASAAAAASATGGWPAPADWGAWLSARWAQIVDDVGDEARALLRVTRIDRPEAMLMAPEQAFFLRENLKLRLLNARLALLSRQFDLAQSDLQQSRQVLERYFDRGSRRVSAAIEQLGQVAAQTRQVPQPRPDETLAALSAANAGR